MGEIRKVRDYYPGGGLQLVSSRCKKSTCCFSAFVQVVKRWDQDKPTCCSCNAFSLSADRYVGLSIVLSCCSTCIICCLNCCISQNDKRTSAVFFWASLKRLLIPFISRKPATMILRIQVIFFFYDCRQGNSVEDSSMVQHMYFFEVSPFCRINPQELYAILHRCNSALVTWNCTILLYT